MNKKIKIKQILTPVFFVAIIAFALGISVGLYILNENSQNSIIKQNDPKSTLVLHEKTNDEKSVKLQINGGGIREINSNTSGVVTKLNLMANQVVKSGDKLIYIDNKPITFKYSKTPLYKDLDNLIWIPSVTARIQTVSISLGDTITSGQKILSILKPITQVKITDIPQEKMIGQRILSIGKNKIVVPKNKILTSQKDLNIIENSTEYVEKVDNQNSSGNSLFGNSENSNDNEISIIADFVLNKSKEVSVISPSSLITDDSGTSCVLDNSKKYLVTVIGSELGRTFVQFSSKTTPKEVDFLPDENTVCK